MVALGNDFLDPDLDEAIADRARCRTELASLRRWMAANPDADSYLVKLGWQCESLERWIDRYDQIIEAAA